MTDLTPAEIAALKAMPEGDYKVWVAMRLNSIDDRLDTIEERQKMSNRILWGMAGTAGAIVLQRFVMFLLDSGALSGLAS